MQRIIFEEFGAPEKVLSCSESQPKNLAEGEVRVRILASPINPADINFVQGIYGIVPELPATPGMEACGEVMESRSAAFCPGERVIFLDRSEVWAEQTVCDAGQLLKIPQETPVDQASMLKVNPLTAWAMLTQLHQIPKGGYVVQNAANSGVGVCVIQIAKLLGIKTINLVRRSELIPELENLGGDLVLLDDADSVKTIQQHAPTLALNAVGGDSALRLMDSLAPCGMHVTYGAMSRRSLKVPNKFLIFKRIQLHGFWLTEWIKEVEKSTVLDAYAEIASWMAQGKLVQPIDSEFSLAQITEAVGRAQEDYRNGKVILKPAG